jgi:signal transduction histidine kinase
LTALQQISLDIGASLNLGAVLDSVAKHTSSLIPADEITIYLYDEHNDTLLFGAGLSGHKPADQPPIPISENWLTASTAREAKPSIIHQATHSTVPEGWPIGAIASFPLQKAGHVLGVFDVAFGQPHYFAEDELRALSLLADQAAIAIQNAQLFRQVHSANEAKSEFVSIVSHELKIPMTSIQGYARLMTLGAAGQINAQQLEFANIILRNVERMGNLVSDLLDLSRIESGRISISPRPVALDKIIHDAIRSIQEQIDARDHTLRVTVPPDLPEVLADPVRLVQVLTNLISNAYKFTPRGGQISIWAQEQANAAASQDDRAWVLCAVEDNGVGIAPKDREHIFEQFYRVQSPGMRKEQGTGLGLSIARSIVELHGGHIWVESEVAQGTTFFFTLPAA